MADRKQGTVADGDVAGGLILVSILCLCGLALLLLWMSGWSNVARPVTGPAETGDWFIFADPHTGYPAHVIDNSLAVAGICR